MSARRPPERARECFVQTAGGLTLLLALATVGAGQAPQSWTFVATPYAWLAGLGGQVGIGDRVSTVDLGPTEILRHLRFGAMASFEARKGPLVFGGDALYSSVGAEKAFAIRGASGDLSLDQRETIIQPTAGYSIGGVDWRVDALVGARYWNLNAGLDLNPSRVASRSASGTKSWLDATGGLRVRISPMERLHLVAEGDGGGGGSKSSWNTAGRVSYDLSKHYDVMTAYRYLSVNYDRGGFLFDTHMNGWLVGMNFHF